MANQETFEYEGKTYKVRLPNSREREDGERIYNRVFATSIGDGCLFDGQVMKYAKDKGLWNDEKEADVARIRQELADKEKVLEEGGIEFEDAKKIAVEMKALRAQLIIYNMMLEEIKSQSANRKADVARVDYFVSRCLLDDKGRQVYKDLDDFYLNQNSELAQLATFHFSKVWYNYNEDSFSFPEDKFIKEFDLEDELFPQPEKRERKPFLKDGKPVEPKKKVEEEVTT